MEVNCSFTLIDWENNNILYTCEVTAASITEPGTDITNFKGCHIPGKSNIDVEAISFDNIEVKYFPRRISETFPNLIALQIENCGLRSISRSDLSGLENLNDVSIVDNDLVGLPNDLFENFHKLTAISLDGNRLEFLSSQLLIPVINNDLICVRLHDNISIDAFFEPGIHGSLSSPQELMQVIDEKCKKPSDVGKSFAEATIAGFKNLWSSKRLHDFVIIAGEKKFPVHKVVLAIRSPFFLKLFAEDSRSSEMKIHDICPGTVEKYLQFIYTGEISDEACDAMELFALANKCEAPELKIQSQELVLKNLNQVNAYKALVLGNHYSSEKIKRAAFNTIKNMFPGTVLSDDFMHRPEKLQELIESKRIYEAMLKKFETITP